MKKNIGIVVLVVVVVIQSVLLYRARQCSKQNTITLDAEWPEPLKEPLKIIDEDGFSYSDPVIRYAPDAVFPKVSQLVAKHFVPNLVEYANDQLKYTHELIAQAHWYHRHLEIALNRLETQRGLSLASDPGVITPYKKPDYQPFALDPNYIGDERCFCFLLNKAASTNYDILNGINDIKYDIDDFYQRLQRLEPLIETTSK